MKRVLLVILIITSGVLALPQLQYHNLFRRSVHASSKEPTPHIIGGREATPHSIPYQAFLEIFYEDHVSYCGGSLISENFVLTAGHCGHLALDATVILGAHKILEDETTQIEIKASQIIVHEEYDHELILNDICLIRLSDTVTFSTSIQPIALTPADKTYEGIMGKVSGWGYTSGFATQISNTLNYVEALIISNEECEQDFSITEKNICLSGDDDTGSCKGDSGGPLVVDNVQVGIVSYGIVFCLSGFPTVLTRVSSYLDWIEDNTQINVIP